MEIGVILISLALLLILIGIGLLMSSAFRKNIKDAKYGALALLLGILTAIGGFYLTPDAQGLLAEWGLATPPAPAPPPARPTPPPAPAETAPAPAAASPAPASDPLFAQIAAANSREQIMALAQSLQERRDELSRRQQTIKPEDLADMDLLRADILTLNQLGRDLKAAAERVRGETQPAPPPPVVEAPAPPAIMVMPEPPAWSLDLPKTLPATAALGKLDGHTFSPGAAELASGGILTLRQGDALAPELALSIYLYLPAGESPAGKTYEILPDASASAPLIYLKTRQPGQEQAEKRKFAKGYALRLEFDPAPKDGKLAGRLHLSLPDDKKSTVTGSFAADIVP